MLPKASFPSGRQQRPVYTPGVRAELPEPRVTHCEMLSDIYSSTHTCIPWKDPHNLSSHSESSRW